MGDVGQRVHIFSSKSSGEVTYSMVNIVSSVLYTENLQGK